MSQTSERTFRNGVPSGIGIGNTGQIDQYRTRRQRLRLTSYADLTNERPERRAIGVLVLILLRLVFTTKNIHETRTIFGFGFGLVLFLLVLLVATFLVFRIDVLGYFVCEGLGVLGHDLLRCT